MIFKPENKKNLNHTSKWLCYLIVIVLSLSGCTGKIDKGNEVEAVEDLLDRFISAFETKDLALLSAVFSHDDDMINFGTDADEVWIGWDPWKKSFQKQFAAYDKIKIAFNNVSIKIHSSGEIAWFSAFMAVDITSNERPFHYDDMRMTGVAEKRDSAWVFVQRHVSIPVREQAVEY